MNNDNTFDPKHPVSHIQHTEDKRANIPTTERQGEESAIVDGEPTQSEYDVFRHEFCRGRDPELYWLNKYQNDDESTQMPSLRTDIRSLYVHEDITPEYLINRLYRIREERAAGLENQTSLFEQIWAQEDEQDELERVASYYQHSANWRNRLILGDSLLVMNSLLNREGMKGKVQCCYFDPPYGIKFASNWQLRLNSRDVKDNDSNISAEPEMIKAYRDTWELGIHSYLSYLRDRLVMARELLHESGSCFVQISDENIHLVRNLMDEVFGSENFFALITFKKTSPLGSVGLAGVSDYIIWYAKDKTQIKYRQLYFEKAFGAGSKYTYLEFPDGSRRSMTKEEKDNPSLIPSDARAFCLGPMFSVGYTPSCMFDIEYKGRTYKCGKKVGVQIKKGLNDYSVRIGYK